MPSSVGSEVVAYWHPITVTGPDPTTRLVVGAGMFSGVVFTDPIGVVVDRTFAGGIASGRVDQLAIANEWLTIVRFGLARVECFTVHMSDGSRDVTAADVDGDGRLDALTLGADGTVTIIRHAT